MFPPQQGFLCLISVSCVDSVEPILVEIIGILHEMTGLVFSVAYGGVIDEKKAMETGW